MLYAFGFGRVGVVAGDLYFVDPTAEPGQEGPEQGVRLEVRVLEPGALRGSIYSARPIAVERPIWRADLLESVARPGSLDRAHHHPRFHGWEPGRRHFVDEMSDDPVAFVGKQLSDLDALLDTAGVPRDDVEASDADELRNSVPEIVHAVQRLLDRVRAAFFKRIPTGELNRFFEQVLDSQRMAATGELGAGGGSAGLMTTWPGRQGAARIGGEPWPRGLRIVRSCLGGPPRGSAGGWRRGGMVPYFVKA